jgi:hypothetical protein
MDANEETDTDEKQPDPYASPYRRRDILPHCFARLQTDFFAADAHRRFGAYADAPYDVSECEAFLWSHRASYALNSVFDEVWDDMRIVAERCRCVEPHPLAALARYSVYAERVGAAFDRTLESNGQDLDFNDFYSHGGAVVAAWCNQSPYEVEPMSSMSTMVTSSVAPVDAQPDAAPVAAQP